MFFVVDTGKRLPHGDSRKRCGLELLDFEFKRRCTHGVARIENRAAQYSVVLQKLRSGRQRAWRTHDES